MKVVILHTDFKIYWAARLRAISQLLDKNGIELHIVEIASSGSPYSFAEDNPNTYCKRWSVLFENSNINELKPKEIEKHVIKKLDELQAEVVIAGAIAFYSGALATRWVRKNKKRVVIFDDSRKENVPRGWIVNFVKRKIYSAVDAVIYPSYEWIDTAEFWGFNRQQFFIGIDVVDNNFWEHSKRCKQRILLFVGRFIPCKNILKLVEIFDEIPNNNGSKLLIVGDGEQKNEILKQISRSRNIEYHPSVQQHKLKEIYSKASGFIIPSTYDTWGLVINEAMASGLPVWASRECGATSTLVQDGVNGVVFDPFDDDDIRSALVRFINCDTGKLAAMGDESRKIIKDWNLPLLANETLRAIRYVSRTEPRRCDYITSALLRVWRGRYNQI